MALDKGIQDAKKKAEEDEKERKRREEARRKKEEREQRDADMRKVSASPVVEASLPSSSVIPSSGQRGYDPRWDDPDYGKSKKKSKKESKKQTESPALEWRRPVENDPYAATSRMLESPALDWQKPTPSSSFNPYQPASPSERDAGDTSPQGRARPGLLQNPISAVSNYLQTRGPSAYEGDILEDARTQAGWIDSTLQGWGDKVNDRYGPEVDLTRGDQNPNNLFNTSKRMARRYGEAVNESGIGPAGLPSDFDIYTGNGDPNNPVNWWRRRQDEVAAETAASGIYAGDGDPDNFVNRAKANVREDINEFREGIGPVIDTATDAARTAAGIAGIASDLTGLTDVALAARNVAGAIGDAYGQAPAAMRAAGEYVNEQGIGPSGAGNIYDVTPPEYMPDWFKKAFPAQPDRDPNQIFSPWENKAVEHYQAEREEFREGQDPDNSEIRRKAGQLANAVWLGLAQLSPEIVEGAVPIGGQEGGFSFGEIVSAFTDAAMNVDESYLIDPELSGSEQWSDNVVGELANRYEARGGKPPWVMTEEERAAAAYSFLGSYSGTEAQGNIFTFLANQDEIVAKTRALAAQAQMEGKPEEAAALGALADQQENMTPSDVLDANYNVVPELIFSAIFDPLNLIDGLAALGKFGPASLRAGRRAAAMLEANPEAIIKNVDELASAIVQGPKVGAGDRSKWNFVGNFFGLTDSSRAQMDAHNAWKATGRLIGPIEDKAQARQVVDALLNNPTSLPDALKEANRGVGILADDQYIDALKKLVPILKDQVSELASMDEAFPSLSGAGPFNKMQFNMEMLRELSESGMKYYNVAEEAGSAKKLLGLMRGVMSDQFLNTTPRHLINNGLSAIGHLFMDGQLTFRPMDSIIDDLMLKFGDMPSVRTAEAYGSEVAGQTGSALEYYGGTNRLHNVLSQIPGYGDVTFVRDAQGNATPRWASTANGGEQNFYARGLWTRFRNALSDHWTREVNQNLGPSLQQMGLDPQTASMIQNRVIESGINGNRASVINDITSVVNGNASPLSLKQMGLEDGVLSEKASYDIVNKTLNDYNSGAITRQQAIDEVVSVFENEENLAGQIFANAGGTGPARSFWSRSDDAMDAATTTQRLNKVAGREVAQRFARQAQKEYTAFYEGFSNALKNAGDLNSEIRGVFTDVWSDVQELKQQYRVAQGKAFDVAIDIQTKAGWDEYRSTVEAAARSMFDKQRELLTGLPLDIDNAKAGKYVQRNESALNVMEKMSQSNLAELEDVLETGTTAERIAAQREYTDFFAADAYATAQAYGADINAVDVVMSAEVDVEKLSLIAKALQDQAYQIAEKSNDWIKYDSEVADIWGDWALTVRDRYQAATSSIMEGVEAAPPTRAATQAAPPTRAATQAAPPARAGGGQVTGFTTAQGSTYTFDGLTTTRRKTPHAGHVVSDVGLKEQSARTVFIADDNLQSVQDMIYTTTPIAGEGRNAITTFGEDANRGVMIIRKVDPKNGNVVAQVEVPYSMNPEVGLSPLETWSAASSSSDRAHLGNKITSLQTSNAAPVSQAGTAAQASPKTLEDLYRVAAQANIGTDYSVPYQTSARPNFDHIRRTINKDLGINVGDLSELSQGEIDNAFEALTKRADEVRREGLAPSQPKEVSVITEPGKVSKVFVQDEGMSVQDAYQSNTRARGASRNSQGPSVSDAAYYRYERLKNGRKSVINSLTNDVTPVGGAMPREIAVQILDAVNGMLPRYDDILNAAAEAGITGANYSMLNYASRRGFDTVLSAVVPYHYWYTRSAMNWLERIAAHPGTVAAHQMTHRASDIQKEQEGIPQRYGDMVRVPGTNNQLWVKNLSDFALPINDLYWFNGFADPNEANTAVAKVLESSSLYGLGTWPVLDAAIKYYDGRGEEVDWGNVAYPMSLVNDVVKTVTGNDVVVPGVQGVYEQVTGDTQSMFRGPYDDGTEGRAGGELAVQGAFSADAIMYADQMIVNEAMGNQPFLYVPEHMQKEALAAYETMKARQGRQQLTRTASSFFGLPMATLSPEELEARQAGREYGQAGYGKDNRYGSQAARERIIEKYPFLPAWWSKSDLYPGEIENANPGIMAQTTQYWDEYINLAEQRTEAVKNYILANPSNVTSEGIREIKAPYYDQMKALKDKYPDVEEFESRRDRRKNAMNPFEEAAQVVEDIMRYNPPGRPQSPWEGEESPTDEEVKQYYSDLGVWYEKKLDHKERVLEQMLLDDTGAADTAQNIVAQIVTGHFAADILSAFDLRYASGPEVYFEEQKDYQQEMNSQEYDRRKAESDAKKAADRQKIADTLGPDAVELWNELYSLPAGEARYQFKLENEVLFEAADLVWHPEHYQRAKETWGEDIYDLVRSYPGPKGENPKEWQAWKDSLSSEDVDRVFGYFGWNKDQAEIKALDFDQNAWGPPPQVGSWMENVGNPANPANAGRDTIGMYSRPEDQMMTLEDGTVIQTNATPEQYHSNNYLQGGQVVNPLQGVPPQLNEQGNGFVMPGTQTNQTGDPYFNNPPASLANGQNPYIGPNYNPVPGYNALPPATPAELPALQDAIANGTLTPEIMAQLDASAYADVTNTSSGTGLPAQMAATGGGGGGGGWGGGGGGWGGGHGGGGYPTDVRELVMKLIELRLLGWRSNVDNAAIARAIGKIGPKS